MMKRFLYAIALIISVSAIAPPVLRSQEIWDGSADTEWVGDGTSDSPYLISTPAQLAGLAKRTNADETFEGKYFRLTADIWLSDTNTPADERPMWVPIASHDINNDDQETNPGGWYGEDHWFKGTFDGDGHTIHNLWFSGTTNFEDFDDPFGDGQIDFSGFNKALFGGLDGATICNLNIKNVNIGGAIVAGLAIESHNTTFTDIYIDGHVKAGDIKNGGSASGMVLEAYNSHFSRCVSNVNVYSYSVPACLVGRLKAASTIEYCSAGGSATGCVNVGGLVGNSSAWTESGDDAVPTIRNSWSSATVTIISGRNQGNDGGGFIGMNSGYIYNSYATGKVHVTTDAGAGFCSVNVGHIESCYATGDVYNEEYGVSLATFVMDNGLNAGWGEYHPGTILNCYGAGKLYAPECPPDIIGSPTHLYGFMGINDVGAGSRMANCYYDSTKTPDLYADMELYLNGAYGASTEYMQSKEFVDSLNMMAAVMGTTLWQHTPGSYPTLTDVKATDVRPLFAGGDGSEANPFIISNKEQLKNLAFAANRNWNFSGQYLKQTADIELNGPFETWGEVMPTPWIPIADGGGISHSDYRIPHFCGIYDGGMHTISNMYIDSPSKVYQGLFGMLGKGAEIKNLGVIDAWVNSGRYSGILAGATRIHNDADQFKGPSSIYNCWTSGQISSLASDAEIGGIIGYCPYGGDFTMNACYSTAEVSGKGLLGAGVTDETFFNGCWFGGTAPAGMDPLANSMNFFWTFVDATKNPISEKNMALYKLGRSTEYMQSRQFVNDLNYAAAAKGVEGGWRYNQGAYPSFVTGEQPTVTVTISDGINDPFQFKALSGTSLSKPTSPEREGYVLAGWYTDEAMTNLFEFGKTNVEANTTLYARWIEEIAPDYTIFKNKFTKTFTITTAAQLYGFANIVNGTAEGVDKSDFSDKTVKLGADIELNDVSDYDQWGISVTPKNFITIANAESNPFNGIFDGQGHSISGLYIEGMPVSYRLGLFGCVGANAEISNTIIKCAYIKAVNSAYTGILAGEVSGSVLHCGAEGKIVSSYASTDMYNGGLIGHTGTASTVSECYAIADIESFNNLCGGLIGWAQGDIDNCFATGSVSYVKYGSFGGMVGRTDKAYTNCYSAVSLSWNDLPKLISVSNVGGSYGYAGYGSNPGIYDRDLVTTAFNMLLEGDDTYAYNKGKGLSSPEMKTMAAYDGWDFANVWGRRDDRNGGYPYLRWTAPGLDNDPDADITIAVRSITLSQPSISGKKGDTVQLTATVDPDNATVKDLVWTSSNTDVATVNETGLVTLVEDGTAVITAAATDESGVSASCDVTVETPVIPVSSVTVSPRTFRGEVGETKQLTAEIWPGDATDKTVTWTSSDAGVATVTEDGLVTITGEGYAQITATTTNGMSGSCSVYGRSVEVQEIRLEPSFITGEVGETIQLTATVLPENATDKTVTWKVEQEASSMMESTTVATVDQTGLVTIVGEGRAAVIATAVNGVEARCEISATSGIENITINADDEVEIFTLQGHRIYFGRYADANLTPGFYIIRHGDGVSKISVK